VSSEIFFAAVLLNGHRRKFLHLEKIGAAQVVVALDDAGIDARGLYLHLHGTLLRVLRVERHRAGEIARSCPALPRQHSYPAPCS
jgi:hypothetical protein